MTPSKTPPIQTAAFEMTLEDGRRLEVEVRGSQNDPLFVVLIDDEWMDAHEHFTLGDWQTAFSYASEPMDTCHHGN
jgi:hypothetical protein